MFVFVKTFTGQTWRVEVDENSTGYDVKLGIEAQGGIPAYSAVLIFAGQLVENDALIDEINPEHELMVVRRVPGAKKLTAQLPCRVCGKQTKNGCSRCDIAYCGRACQAEDWGTHAATCKTSK